MSHSPLKLDVVHSKIKGFICGTYSAPSIYFLSILNHKTAFKLPPWPYVAVRGAESSLSSLSQNNVLNLRIRNSDKEEEQKHRDKANRSCWKGLFAYRNFKGENSEVFVCYSFQIQASFVIQTRESNSYKYIFR